MKKFNAAHVAAIKEMIDDAPYFRLLGMEFLELTPGFSKFIIDIDAAKHHSPFGQLHGATYASLVDTAAYWAAYYDIPEDAGLITLDLNVDYLSTLKNGRVSAQGKLIKAGRTVCLTEAQVVDENGKLLCHGKSKLLVTQGLQTLSQALENMGKVPLPPKYEE